MDNKRILGSLLPMMIMIVILAAASVARPSQAQDIVAVPTAGNWKDGTDVISGLGFKMEFVAENSNLFVPFSSLTAPTICDGNGQIGFSSPMEPRRALPDSNGWFSYWGHGFVSPIVYWSRGVSTVDLDLSGLPSVTAVDFFVEPDCFGTFSFTVEAIDETDPTSTPATLTQDATASIDPATTGAAYFGFYVTRSTLRITRVHITTPCQAFAIGQLRVACKFPCPFTFCSSQFCYVETETRQSEAAGRVACEALGLRLADIPTSAEYNFVNSILEEQSFFNSWQTNDYGTTCIAFAPGIVGGTTAQPCNAQLHALCQIEKPAQC